MSLLSPNYAKTADGATEAGGDQETGGSLPREEGFSSLQHLTFLLKSNNKFARSVDAIGISILKLSMSY